MKPSSIIHPAVWTGPELEQKPEWHHLLTGEEQDELLHWTSQVDADPDPERMPHVNGRPVENLEPREVPLPLLGKRCVTIQHQLEQGAGAVRVRGLPLAGLSAGQVKTLLWILGIHLGTPVSQSAQGEKIFSVKDAGLGDKDPRARGPNTRRRLSFHTDRCDVIAFLCLQQARTGGDNEVISSMALYNDILHQRPDLIEVLTEPFYYQRHTVDQGNDKPWCQQPVFSFCQGHFACCFLRVLIERAHQDPTLPDLSPRQKEALDFLESLAGQPERSIQFRQEPGDLLFLNNWVTLHRRQAFEDHSDPALRRHILRMWLAVPNSRPLDPLFRDNYGTVEAGAVRGGMRAS